MSVKIQYALYSHNTVEGDRVLCVWYS